MKRTTLCLAVCLATSVVHADDWRAKTSSDVRTGLAAGGDVDVMILLNERAAVVPRSTARTAIERRALFVDALRRTADASQHDLRVLLDQNGIKYHAFWVANAIAARVPASLVPEIAARSEVRIVESNAVLRETQPSPWLVHEDAPSPEAPLAVAWGVTKVRAPLVWAEGFRGQGVVVAGQDTGYQWDHPALKGKYRGWNGVSASHAYNWHDAIHSLIGAGANSCGLNVTAPCDDGSHGTHTMGTMVGDDGAANQIGVAPDAKWIGCRNMEEGDGRPETYTECFQWFIAPTDSAGGNPDPARAPDIINNSWGCPASELCDAVATEAMRAVVENVKAAGILVVVSAGNDGGSCGTVTTPAAIYEASFTIGATGSNDAIAGFSSRGPVNIAGVDRLKPNVSGPGVSICSSVPANNYSCSFSGTSMAGPHVAGVAALIMSANPSLKGDPEAVEDILESTAVPLTVAQTCGSNPAFPGTVVPNAVFGYGRVDAFAAYQAAIAGQDVPMMLDGFE